MNEVNKDKVGNVVIFIMCICCLVACGMSIWATTVAVNNRNKVANLESEMAQAYFIEEGTAIEANQYASTIKTQLDNGKVVLAEVLLTETLAGCDAHNWDLKGVRIAVLHNKVSNEYIVMTVFGREVPNVNTMGS